VGVEGAGAGVSGTDVLVEAALREEVIVRARRLSTRNRTIPLTAEAARKHDVEMHEAWGLFVEAIDQLDSFERGGRL
jgi:hypothetical protein